MWFSLRSPALAEDFERLMASDRDVVRGSLDTMSDYRLTRPMDVPGQAIESADYVLIAEIHNIGRWEQQAEARVRSLEDDLAHLVSSAGCSSSNASFEKGFSSDATSLCVIWLSLALGERARCLRQNQALGRLLAPIALRSDGRRRHLRNHLHTMCVH